MITSGKLTADLQLQELTLPSDRLTLIFKDLCFLLQSATLDSGSHAADQTQKHSVSRHRFNADTAETEGGEKLECFSGSAAPPADQGTELRTFNLELKPEHSQWRDDTSASCLTSSVNPDGS